MIIYVVKGLEWDVVVVFGFVEGVFLSYLVWLCFDGFGWVFGEVKDCGWFFGFGKVLYVLCGDGLSFLDVWWDVVVD